MQLYILRANLHIKIFFFFLILVPTLVILPVFVLKQLSWSTSWYKVPFKWLKKIALKKIFGKAQNLIYSCSNNFLPVLSLSYLISLDTQDLCLVLLVRTGERKCHQNFDFFKILQMLRAFKLKDFHTNKVWQTFAVGAWFSTFDKTA